MNKAALLICVLLAGCASRAPASPASFNPARPPEAARDALVLTPDADGTWTAQYAFAEVGTEWVFPRSRGDYRTSTWTSLSEGASIVREDGVDRIRLAEPGREVRFRFTPTTGPLDRTYDPALVFTDGSVALYLDQFSVVPLDRALDAIATPAPTPGDLSVTRPCLDVTFGTESRVVAGGTITQGPYRLEPFCEPAPDYVYVGDIPLTRGAAVTGVIDPGLPDWLRNDLEPRLAATFDELSRRFGDPLEATPAVLLSFGSDPIEGLSQTGGFLPGLLAFSLSGTAFDAPNERLSRYLDWFLAHEGTHVFQFRDGQDPSRAPWLYEGHASAMAYDVVADIGGASSEWAAEEIAAEDGVCDGAITGVTLAQALADQPYACGQRVWRALVSGQGARYAPLWDAMLESAGDEPLTPEHLAAALSVARGQALLRALETSGQEAFEVLER